MNEQEHMMKIKQEDVVESDREMYLIGGAKELSKEVTSDLKSE